MLNEILQSAMLDSGFIQINSNEQIFSFKRYSGDECRFVILKNTNNLDDVDIINSSTIEVIPTEIKDDPAFNKNTDLILVVKFGQLSDFKKVEDKIFSIEEDPYHFKKYVLYYIEGEERLLAGKTFEDIRGFILNRESFKQYKSSPLNPSLYGIAARIFIKLPFLDMPINESQLTPLALQADALLSESNFLDLHSKIVSLDSPSQYDELIKDLIGNELENI
jgi:hypothetical protein